MTHLSTIINMLHNLPGNLVKGLILSEHEFNKFLRDMKDKLPPNTTLTTRHIRYNKIKIVCEKEQEWLVVSNR